MRTKGRRLQAFGVIALACVSILTIASPEWIEAVFHVDPDAGSGALEYAIAAAFAAGALLVWLVGVVRRRKQDGRSEAGASRSQRTTSDARYSPARGPERGREG